MFTYQVVGGELRGFWVGNSIYNNSFNFFWNIWSGHHLGESPSKPHDTGLILTSAYLYLGFYVVKSLEQKVMSSPVGI